MNLMIFTILKKPDVINLVCVTAGFITGVNA